MPTIFRHLPRVVKETLRSSLQALQHAALNEGGVLDALHFPSAPDEVRLGSHGRTTWRARPSRASAVGGGAAADALPLPPPDLRMAYHADDSKFLESGQRTSGWIRRLAAREGIELAAGATVLDWGCASGRVLRHFEHEARGGEFWGADPAADYIAWDRANLAPPFHFVTTTAFPRLPFEDRTFDLVYGVSVFTHLRHLRDLWLMELRRVLRPGGIALLTVNDEHSWRWFREHPGSLPEWLPPADLKRDLTDDIVIFGVGRWERVQTFFHTSYLAREWGHYFEVLSFEPLAESFQSAVVLRKPRARRDAS